MTSPGSASFNTDSHLSADSFSSNHGELVPTHSSSLSIGQEVTSQEDYEELSEPPTYQLKNDLSKTWQQDEDQPVSISISSKPYTKLEVIDAQEIKHLMRWFAVGMVLGAGVSIMLLVFTHTLFKSPAAYKTDFGEEYTQDGFFPSRWYVLIVGIFRIVILTVLLIMLVLYMVRIGRLPKVDRTHQQVWVIILLVSALFYLNPYWDLVQISDSRRQLHTPDQTAVGRIFAGTFFDAVRITAFPIMTMFYMWASMHSYGMFKLGLGLRFYLTKGLLILGYVIIQNVLFLKFNVRVAEMPLASLIAMLVFFKLYDNPRRIPTDVAISVSLMTVYEILLVVLIVRRALITKKTLEKVDYLRYRTKQIGFRFFLYDSVNFYIIFWVFYVIALVATPPGHRFFTLVSASHTLYLDFEKDTLGLEILILVYAVLETYLNLPADAVGLRGWIYPQPKVGDLSMTPVTYRKLEPMRDEKNSVDYHANCFVMQTHVEMFNFAWLVYYHGTRKYAGLRQSPGLFSYKIKGHVHDAETDSHALVIDASDRILVAFRGTNSARNLRTDMKAFHMPCSKVIPTKLDEHDFQTDDPVVQKTLQSRDFAAAKLHKGFATAYMSINKGVLKMIKELYDKRERPIYLTGHSLGGALAVIASFDLCMKMGLLTNEVFVSSFGAPRAGNASFRKLYNEHVPSHWRIVIGPDIVTKLPKVGYQHVGKKVLLTTSGDLFIDPNSLENKHWHGDHPSILYHRKASYLLAMRAWCRKHHHGTYEPNFWQFPYTEEDSRRFPDAAVATRRPLTKSRRRDGHLRLRRIMSLDALVDALDPKQDKDVSEPPLRNWERLTRRALLKEQFETQW